MSLITSPSLEAYRLARARAMNAIRIEARARATGQALPPLNPLSEIDCMPTDVWSHLFGVFGHVDDHMVYWYKQGYNETIMRETTMINDSGHGEYHDK